MATSLQNLITVPNHIPADAGVTVLASPLPCCPVVDPSDKPKFLLLASDSLKSPVIDCISWLIAGDTVPASPSALTLLLKACQLRLHSSSHSSFKYSCCCW
ncbi:hypothetical protein CLOP_g24019 [Closterium sp. NIES-67]|nr:hypothetical protein CLOP_g24019 [Closterium sp. NIES-67]